MQSNLNPYLSFAGKAREALTFYQTIFGGEATFSTFGEAGVPSAPSEGIMHAQLTVDGKPLIMASDGMDDKEFKGFSLSLSGTAGEELRNYFDKLAEGGQITKPLEKESWGDEFGMVVDKFGVNWMFNITAV
jgi:PhnB protein